MFYKKRIASLAMILCLCFSSIAHAASFEGQVDDVSGGGRISRSEAESAIQKRLQNPAEDSNVYVCKKESDYLVYVCVTQAFSYDDYNNYATQFEDEYNKKNLDFKVLTKEKYNEKLIATTKIENNLENKDRILVADSGFRVDKNTLKFSNFGVTYGATGGVCSGFSSLSLFSYVEPSRLKNANFTNTYNLVKDSYAIYKKDYMTTDVTFNKKVLQSKAHSYNPTSDILKSKIPHPALDFREVITAENYDAYLKSFNKYSYDNIDIENIKNKNDKELVKGLHWLWAWNNENLFYERETYKVLSAYIDTNPCPSSELDLVYEELKQGRPVEVSIRTHDGGHSVVGYRMWQDKKDANFFYIDIYDSNLPNNSDLTYFKYEPTLIIYKGMHGTDLALYYCYAPCINFDNYKIETAYRFTEKLEFLNYKGQLLHKNNYKSAWGDDLGLIDPLDF